MPLNCFLTVSNSLQFLGGKGLRRSKDWLITAQFVKLVNDWFDIFNSSVYKDSAGKRNSFQKTQMQMEVLNGITSKIKSLRVKNRFITFQKGILISCHSLVSLYDTLHNRYDIKYILTRRLNQDVVESFFGVIRQMGQCYDHPTPLSFQNRIKLYIMGKDTQVLSPGANCEDVNCSSITQVMYDNTEEDSGFCLVARIFRNGLSSTNAPNDINDNNEPNKILDSDLIEEEILDIEVPEEEAINHFLGYVVHKFRLKYPELGHRLEITEEDGSWDAYISKGGLKIMKPEYRSVLLNVDRHFYKFHGETLKEGESIEEILKRAELPCFFPAEVARFVIRCKIYFKIKKMNHKLQESKYGCAQKGSKKMKTIVN